MKTYGEDKLFVVIAGNSICTTCGPSTFLWFKSDSSSGVLWCPSVISASCTKKKEHTKIFFEWLNSILLYSQIKLTEPLRRKNALEKEGQQHKEPSLEDFNFITRSKS